jgi:L-fuculose-phosphate aldolase
MIVEIGRRLEQKGYVASNDAAISVKLASNKFLITPTGVYKGFLEEEALVVVDIDGKVLASNKFYTPTTDILLHLRTYRTNSAALGVVHAQPPNATSFAVAGEPLFQAILPRTVSHLGEVPVSPYATPGTPAAADAIEPHVAGHNALLLGNRGVLAWGSNLYEAYSYLDMVEQYAQVTILSRLIAGHPRLLSTANRDELLQRRKKYGITAGGLPITSEEFGAGKLPSGKEPQHE